MNFIKIATKVPDLPPYPLEAYPIWLSVGDTECAFALVATRCNPPTVKLTHYASGLAFVGENLCDARVSPQQLVDEVVARHGAEKVLKTLGAAKVLNDDTF